MKFLFALTAVLALGCSSSQKKPAADDAAATPAKEVPAPADAMPAAPAEDAGPAISMDAMPAGSDDEKPPMPAAKK